MKAGLVLCAAALVLAGCSDPYAEPRAPKPRPRQSYGRDSGPLIAPGQDSPDPGERREAARSLRRPAFAHLPYLGQEIAVDYVDERAGKLVLLVVHRGSRRQARAGYRRFLARYGDDGRAYIVRFQRAAAP
jgi:hypothetical protein